MKKYTDRLKATFEQYPLETIAISAAALTAAAKIMQANTERKNAKTWAKEVDRRRMMS